VVRSSGLDKVVPEADAKLQSEAVRIGGPANGQSNQIVTQIFKLNFENANNLVSVLRPLISPNNIITVNAGNNSLIITDYADNLLRLGTIVEALDTPSATDVEVISLAHAVAADIVPTVRRLLESSASSQGSGGGAGSGSAPGAMVSTIVPDTQSNSLLVRAANAHQLASIRALVARLDRAKDSSNVHVVYLKNTDAVRLALVLRAAFPTDGASGAVGNGSGGVLATGTASATADSAGTGKTASAHVATAAQPTAGGGIQADPMSNALIINAAEPKFKEMRQVIEQLDTRRAQLYVESLVVEVDAQKSADLGVQWAQLFNVSDSTTLTLGTVLAALETVSGTNILSTANVVTLDNEEAEIMVGQNVPFITGSYTSSSNASPFQTIERKDVGITLRIKPQIGQDGSIRMAIYQESSSVSSTSSTLGPTTNKRSIASNVVVNDGKIIVLGGLIEDSATDENNRVPWVADIPLLGAFFRSTSHTLKKTNLLVFLRPVIMADAQASDTLSIDRYDTLRARQQSMSADGLRPALELSRPLLPNVAR
jgi:general secretion pathway protein D